MNESPLFAPYIQYGFAGFCFVLLVMNAWLVKQLVKVLKCSKDVIAGNSVALEKVAGSLQRAGDVLSGIHDKLLSRPCLLEHEDTRSHQRTAAGEGL